MLYGGSLPGSGSFGHPTGCVAAVVIVLLYAGGVLAGLWWLYRFVHPD